VEISLLASDLGMIDHQVVAETSITQEVITTVHAVEGRFSHTNFGNGGFANMARSCVKEEAKLQVSVVNLLFVRGDLLMESCSTRDFVDISDMGGSGLLDFDRGFS
jgi:hypothetical protein